MAVGDTYRLSIRSDFENGGDDAVNVWHFKQKTANVLPNAMADLVLAWKGQAMSAYQGTFASSYAMALASVKQITGGLGVYEEVLVGFGTSGGLATMLPTTVSGLVSWKSGLAGRSKNGRTYLPASNEEQLANGIWTSAYLTGMNNFALQMLGMGTHAILLYGQWEIGVYSPLGGGFTKFISHISRSIPATIRRRRIGSGS